MPIRPRTLASAFRTAIYGAACSLFALTEAQAEVFVDAVLVGAILADYLTWLIRTLLQLPSYVWHGGYDLCVNAVLGVVIFHLVGIEVRTDPDSVVTAFLTFLLVAGIKVAAYGVKAVLSIAADE